MLVSDVECDVTEICPMRPRVEVKMTDLLTDGAFVVAGSCLLAGRLALRRRGVSPVSLARTVMKCPCEGRLAGWGRKKAVPENERLYMSLRSEIDRLQRSTGGLPRCPGGLR
jgi:hypothetical protein